ncbi:type II toxin-antitoxin system RelE/ParE family toxin, partial [Escherichia coli]
SFPLPSPLETLYFSPKRTKRKGSLGTREMLISDSPYRAIIQIDEEAKRVFILRILHTSRNI